MEGARERLEREKRTTLRRLAELRHDFDQMVAASRDTNADDEHDPEGATIAFERSQLGALQRQTERHLLEVNAALERLKEGTYGTCEACGVTIDAGRLEARPAARLCMSCAATRR